MLWNATAILWQYGVCKLWISSCYPTSFPNFNSTKEPWVRIYISILCLRWKHRFWHSSIRLIENSCNTLQCQNRESKAHRAGKSVARNPPKFQRIGIERSPPPRWGRILGLNVDYINDLVRNLLHLYVVCFVVLYVVLVSRDLLFKICKRIIQIAKQKIRSVNLKTVVFCV